MAINRDPVLKRCRSLGIEPAFLGYSKKSKKKPNTSKRKVSEYSLQILESRLDNVVFRLGYATTRAQARQFVTHGLFVVNGNKVDIPSYLVKPEDVITVKEDKKDYKILKELAEVNKSRVVPKWLEKDIDNLSGKVCALPVREEIDTPVEEHLIVELYSK